MNDAVVVLCGVILLLAVLPMVLMSRAFKGAGGRKDGPNADMTAVPGDLSSGKAKSGAAGDDSGGASGPDSRDGGAGGA